MQPILVLGFYRSGTTLLRRIVSMHPSLEYDLIHEGWKLRQFETPHHAFRDYHYKTKQAGVYTGGMSSIKAGEKIAYYKNIDATKMYIDRWLSWWPHALVLHIVRPSDECCRSIQRVKKTSRFDNLPICNNAVGEISKYLSTFDNTVTVPYNYLVSNPVSIVKCIYAAIGEMPSVDYINNVLTRRDPWEYNGRWMCGLRYHNNVGKIIYE